MIETLTAELRNAFRSLRTQPLLVAAAALTLTLSVGLNLAVFGLIGRALLSPPTGVREPDRVFTLAFERPGEGGAAESPMTTTSYVAFRAIRDDVRALAGAAAFQSSDATLLLDGNQLKVKTVLVSGNYLDLLGAQPLRGRSLQPEDDDSGAPPMAVISDGFWRTAFLADEGVLGRRLVVGGVDYHVVGVMPSGFSGHSSESVDVWLPLGPAMRQTPGWDTSPLRNVVSVLVRLAGDQTVAAASQQAGAACERRVSMVGLAGAGIAPPERRVAWGLAGVSLLVLLVGLANASTLLSVRRAMAGRDLAVRSALGASRPRLIREAMGEAILLAIATLLLTLILSSWIDEAVRRVLFPGIIGRGRYGLDAILQAALSGLVAISVAAAVSLGHGSPPPALSLIGHERPSRLKGLGWLTGLLLLQTTFSVVLLSGALTVGVSLTRLKSQDFGMRMSDVAVVDFEQGPQNIPDQDPVFRDALSRIGRVPGVLASTPIGAIPFAGFHVPPISVPGRSEAPGEGKQLPYLTAATPEFLQILGIGVQEGRTLGHEDERGAPVVLVNAAMARAVWPGESAIGKCIRIGFPSDFDPQTFDPSQGPPIPSDDLPCREVVGVTRNVRQRSLLPDNGEDQLMQYFVPFSQVPKPHFAVDSPDIQGLLLRTSGSIDELAPTLRRLIVGSRTDLPFLRVRPYSQLLDRQMRPWTVATRLLGLFSTLALGVAGAGLFASFAYAVTRRRREMAIRMALGSKPADVLGLVLREGMTMAAVGALAGSVLAVLAGRWAQAMLFQTQPSDPLILLSTSGLMLATAGLATWIPARSAARCDPAVLLRTE